MLLAIDIGNTNITLGLFQAGALGDDAPGGDPRRGPRADELELLLDGLLRLDDASFADVSAIAPCSVVPSLTAGARGDRRPPRAAARRRGRRARSRSRSGSTGPPRSAPTGS